MSKMPKAPTLSFEEYRDRKNEGAPMDALQHGLGFNDGSRVVGTQSTVAAKVLEILSRTDTCEGCESAISLREVLAAEIGPLLDKGKVKPNISMLDVVTLGLTTDEQISAFMRRHGVDLKNPEDFEYAQRGFKEAVEYFDAHVAKTPAERINKELRNIRTEEDIYRIFKASAGVIPGRRMLIPQACALLRIVAVIDYVERDPIIKLLPVVAEKLADFETHHIKRPEDGSVSYVTGDPSELPTPLVGFEARPKLRWRVITKLLQKPSNRSEEVVDHIGARFTTDSAIGTVRLIYRLFFHPRHAVFPSQNIRVKETRNTLLDEKAVVDATSNPRKAAELVMAIGTPTVIDESTLKVGSKGERSNAHSSAKYHAIHMTFDLPLTLEDGSRALFPMEIQIVDQESRAVNEVAASHAEYEERQMEAVRNRALGNNLDAEYRKEHGK